MMKVIGCGLNLEMSELNIPKFIAGLDEDFYTEKKDSVLVVKQAATFEWNFEDVYPERPIQSYECSLGDLPECYTLKEARAAAKQMAKNAGVKLIDITINGTADSYKAAILDYARAQL